MAMALTAGGIVSDKIGVIDPAITAVSRYIYNGIGRNVDGRRMAMPAAVKCGKMDNAELLMLNGTN